MHTGDAIENGEHKQQSQVVDETPIVFSYPPFCYDDVEMTRVTSSFIFVCTTSHISVTLAMVSIHINDMEQCNACNFNSQHLFHTGIVNSSFVLAWIRVRFGEVKYAYLDITHLKTYNYVVGNRIVSLLPAYRITVNL